MSFPDGSEGKESACNAGDPGSIPGLGRSLGKIMAIHSNILAWTIPWTEKPGGLQSMGSRRIIYDWVTKQQQTHVMYYILFLLKMHSYFHGSRLWGAHALWWTQHIILLKLLFSFWCPNYHRFGQWETLSGWFLSLFWQAPIIFLLALPHFYSQCSNLILYLSCSSHGIFKASW